MGDIIICYYNSNTSSRATHWITISSVQGSKCTIWRVYTHTRKYLLIVISLLVFDVFEWILNIYKIMKYANINVYLFIFVIFRTLCFWFYSIVKFCKLSLYSLFCTIRNIFFFSLYSIHHELYIINNNINQFILHCCFCSSTTFILQDSRISV